MIFVLIGMLALAFDLGRAYLAKNEAQAFTDSASLEATLELDGTSAGIQRAQARVASNENRWNFGRDNFSPVTIAFAKESFGPWDVYVSDARNYRFARVTTDVPVPLSFFMAPAAAPKVPVGLFLLGEKSTMSVAADSMAGQMINDTYKEGLFPFSPFAHNTVAPHFGLDLGSKYTLRWASTPRLNSDNTCPGDRTQAMITLAEAGGGEERGYIEETSADVIRNAIIYDYQTITRTIGDSVNMTGGAKQTILDALLTRISQDTDPSSSSFADYIRNQRGNGRRLIGAPVNTGYPDYKIVQIGAFFLQRPQEYNQGGNKPFCAEYVGAWLQGAKSRAASDAGSFIARLIR